MVSHIVGSKNDGYLVGLVRMDQLLSFSIPVEWNDFTKGWIEMVVHETVVLNEQW